ncbi:MAG: hypothetical protein EBU90_01760 [Proteobacteria bacterium]|nr:hypothetical protein [Pseudomonadota bacterium]
MEKLKAFAPKLIEKVSDLAVYFSAITTHKSLSSKNIAILQQEIERTYYEVVKDEDKFHDSLSGEMMLVRKSPVEIRKITVSIPDEIYNFYMETKDLNLCSEKFIPVCAKIQKIVSSTPILTQEELEKIRRGDKDLLRHKESKQLFRNRKDKTVSLDANGNYQFFAFRYSAQGHPDLDLRSNVKYESKYCDSQLNPQPVVLKKANVENLIA